MNTALQCVVQRDWQNDDGRDESFPKWFSWCTPQIGISSTHKVMYFHTQNVMQHGATGMFCSSDTVSSLITLPIFFGTSLKTIYNQLCSAHIVYKQFQHSWWSPESQLTACLAVAFRTTDAPSCRCKPSWWNMVCRTNCETCVSVGCRYCTSAVPSVQDTSVTARLLSSHDRTWPLLRWYEVLTVMLKIQCDAVYWASSFLLFNMQTVFPLCDGHLLTSHLHWVAVWIWSPYTVNTEIKRTVSKTTFHSIRWGTDMTYLTFWRIWCNRQQPRCKSPAEL